MQELLAKEENEPSTGGAGCYSIVFVAAKQSGSLHPIFILSNLITACTYLLLGCILINRYGFLFNRVTVLSPLSLRVLTHMLLLSSIIVIFF